MAQSKELQPRPKISILIAVLNEASHISRTLECIRNQNCPSEWLEILVLDGGSSDGTKAIVEGCRNKLNSIRLIDNPGVLSAAGWNIGIKQAQGQVVSILSGHVEIPVDFYSKLVPQLGGEVAGIGGVARTVGGDERSRIIGAAMASPLGSGGANYIGTHKHGQIDTVAFGCYRRECLEAIGGFDERIVRGQDWDLNLRLRTAGYILLCDPKVMVKFYARSSYRALWRRQFLAGLWKPFIHRKNKTRLMLRHMIPALFTGALMLSVLGVLVWPPAIVALVAIVAAHFMAVSWQFFKMNLRLREFAALWWSFFIIHFGYGLGLFLGLINPRKQSKHGVET